MCKRGFTNRFTRSRWCCLRHTAALLCRRSVKATNHTTLWLWRLTLVPLTCSPPPCRPRRRTPYGFTLSLAGSGGCFPLHYDNPGPPNKRALTCLLYLNPDWNEGDGGEVCLRPFLGKEKAIAPLLDRLVGGGWPSLLRVWCLTSNTTPAWQSLELDVARSRHACFLVLVFLVQVIFRSDRVLHRVLPCHAERFMLTVWIDSPDVNPEEESTLRITRSQLDDWCASWRFGCVRTLLLFFVFFCVHACVATGGLCCPRAALLLVNIVVLYCMTCVKGTID